MEHRGEELKRMSLGELEERSRAFDGLWEAIGSSWERLKGEMSGGELLEMLEKRRLPTAELESALMEHALADVENGYYGD